MRSVYEPSSAIQAHLLQDVLRQHGIASHVQGEHLHGAIGELPAGSLVRLLVDEADYAAARRALDDWEQAEPMDEDELASKDRSAQAAAAPDQTTHARPRLQPLWWALGGAGCALLLQWGLTGLPVRSDSTDYNGDGVADEQVKMNALGNALQMTSDRNFDGKIDLRQEFDRTGKPLSAEADDDFNGTMETRWRYRQGNLEQTEVDTDGDGYPDLRSYYDYGVLQRTVYIHRNTGKPVRVEHYRLGKLQRVQLDTNTDGALDTEQLYDSNGQMSAQRAYSPAP